MDGGRDWFWHKVKVGLIAFAVLLLLVCVFFAVVIQTFFPSVPFYWSFVAPFLLLAAIAIAGKGAFLFVKCYERRVIGDGRYHGH